MSTARVARAYGNLQRQRLRAGWVIRGPVPIRETVEDRDRVTLRATPDQGKAADPNTIQVRQCHDGDSFRTGGFE